MEFLSYNEPILLERRRLLRKNQTAAEKVLWLRLRGKQCEGMKFFRQYSVGPYILDFYCPNCRLAIELDGGYHDEKSVKEYDEIRTSYLQAFEIEVVRFANGEVLEKAENTLFIIAAALKKRANHPYKTAFSEPFSHRSEPLLV